ncbi:MAG: acyl carrier protein [Chloroflexota bacterium]|nr:MAG: acyl carrier protein [Chloroflexota bacterium]
MSAEATIERFIVDEIMIGDKQTKIDPDQSLLNSGIIDSLALLRLIGFIEDQYGITIDDGEVIPENFETINDMVRLVERKRQ